MSHSIRVPCSEHDPELWFARAARSPEPCPGDLRGLPHSGGLSRGRVAPPRTLGRVGRRDRRARPHPYPQARPWAAAQAPASVRGPRGLSPAGPRRSRIGLEDRGWQAQHRDRSAASPDDRCVPNVRVAPKPTMPAVAGAVSPVLDDREHPTDGPSTAVAATRDRRTEPTDPRSPADQPRVTATIEPRNRRWEWPSDVRRAGRSRSPRRPSSDSPPRGHPPRRPSRRHRPPRRLPLPTRPGEHRVGTSARRRGGRRRRPGLARPRSPRETN
jgi:hypothetical protein